MTQQIAILLPILLTNIEASIVTSVSIPQIVPILNFNIQESIYTERSTCESTTDSNSSISFVSEPSIIDTTKAAISFEKWKQSTKLKADLHLLISAVEDGDVQATAELANCYYNTMYGCDYNAKKSFELAQKAALKGNLDGKYVLAEIYFWGSNCCNKNSKKSFSIWSELVKQNHAKSMFMLGECYNHGYGVNKDEIIALDWYRRSADLNDIDSQCMLGKYFLKGTNGVEKDEKLSFEWFLKAAEHNNENSIGDGRSIMEAQHQIAICYFTGRGCTSDKNKGIIWYNKVIEHIIIYKDRLNDLDLSMRDQISKLNPMINLLTINEKQNHDACIQHLLGVCYFLGKGCKQDSIAAIQWFHLAAEQGNYDSMVALIKCYSSESDQNIPQTIEWCNKAIDHQHLNSRDVLSYFPNTNDKWCDQLKFRALLKLSETTNADADDMYNVANCYATGIGCEQNLVKSFQLYVRASEQNHLKSMFELIKCYSIGNGCERDMKQVGIWCNKSICHPHFIDRSFDSSLEYFITSDGKWSQQYLFKGYSTFADQNDARGQYKVGQCYLRGIGCEPSDTKAIEWFIRSAENGCIESMFELIRCYATGIGCSTDMTQLIRWCSSAQDHEEFNQNYLKYFDVLEIDATWCKQLRMRGYIKLAERDNIDDIYIH
jgi:TPR repeat protein